VDPVDLCRGERIDLGGVILPDPRVSEPSHVQNRRRIQLGLETTISTHRIARYAADDCVSAGGLGAWQ
jgi:hypothetical protein